MTIAAAREQASFSTLKLGTSCQYTRWLCLVRQSRAWLCPRQGRPPFSLHEDAILATFLLNDGRSLMLMAVSPGEILTLFKSDYKGNMVVSSINDGTEKTELTMFSAVALGFEDADTTLVAHMRHFCKLRLDSKVAKTPEGNIKPWTTAKVYRLDQWHDSLAYCTSNGLGQDLNEEELLTAVNVLSDREIRLSTLIVDDNWQSLDFKGESPFEYRWTKFEANRSRFP